MYKVWIRTRSTYVHTNLTEDIAHPFLFIINNQITL